MKLLMCVMIFIVAATAKDDLFEIIMAGNIERIQEYRGRGRNLIQYDEKGVSSLIYSIEAGNESIVDLLIGEGSNLNYVPKDGVSTFLRALRAASLDNYELSSFHITRNIRLLLEAGVLLDMEMIKEKSLFHEFSKAHSLYHLYSATMKMDLKTHNFLRMVRKGNFKEVSKLSGEVNLDTQNIFYYPVLKYSPIHIAIIKDYRIFELLIKKQCDINIKSRIGENTPLILASSRGQTDYVRTLVSNNAELNLVNSQGNTAIMEAILNSENLSSIFEILEILLSAGADQNIENHAGETLAVFIKEMFSQDEQKDLLSSDIGKFLQKKMKNDKDK